jgi:hypothetical protein
MNKHPERQINHEQTDFTGESEALKSATNLYNEVFALQKQQGKAEVATEPATAVSRKDYVEGKMWETDDRFLHGDLQQRIKQLNSNGTPRA